MYQGREAPAGDRNAEGEGADKATVRPGTPSTGEALTAALAALDDTIRAVTRQIRDAAPGGLETTWKTRLGRLEALVLGGAGDGGRPIAEMAQDAAYGVAQLRKELRAIRRELAQMQDAIESFGAIPIHPRASGGGAPDDDRRCAAESKGVRCGVPVTGHNLLCDSCMAEAAEQVERLADEARTRKLAAGEQPNDKKSPRRAVRR